MKQFFTNRLMLLTVFLSVGFSAFAAKTYKSTANAYASPSTGAGSVYVKYNGAASTGDKATATNSQSTTGSPSSDMYYFLASTTSNAYYFVGWYTAANGTGEQKSTSLSYNESITPTEGGATLNRYAYWKAKTAPTVTAPVAKNLKYTGSAQTLITAGSVDGGTLQYSSDGTTFSATLPTATKAGDYTVYYKVVGDDKHLDVASTPVSATIAKAALNITAKSETITYGDPAPAFAVDYSGFVAGEDAGVLTGTLAFECSYEQGSNVGEYLITPSGLTAENYAITFNTGKLTVGKADAAFTTLPAAVEGLAYTGEAQALISAGETADGTILYSLNDEEHYAEALPTATEVGTYTVYYKVEGDANHKNVDAASIEVSIAKARAVVTNAPKAVEGLQYTGEAQTLINADQAAAEGGTLVYSLDGENFAEDLPAAINAQTYTVSYYAKADESHSDAEIKTIEVTIAKIDAAITSAPSAAQNLTYTGEVLTLINAEEAVAVGGAFRYSLDGENYAETLPAAINAGDYVVYVRVAGDMNHNDVAGENIAVTIAKADAAITTAPTAAENLTFTGEALTLLAAEGVGNGGIMEYSLDSVTFAAVLPAETNAGEYIVYVRVAGDQNHNDVAGENIAVTIAKADASITVAPTAAENLTFNGEAQALLIAEGEGNGGIMEYSLDSVTFAAVLPAETNAGDYIVYVRVAGDMNHNDVAGENIAVTIAKANSELMTAPTAAVNLAYTGQPQALLATPGEAVGGDIQYSFDDSNYSTDLPTATNAGDYTIYYKVAGDLNHNDVAAAQIEVSISTVDAQFTVLPEGAEGLEYNGAEQNLLAKLGVADGGIVKYSLDEGEEKLFTEDMPTATNAGEYKIYYVLVADDNHNDGDDPTYLTVTIGKVDAACTVTPTAATGLEYSGEAQALLATAGEAVGGTMQYSLDNVNFVDTLLKVTDAGDYTVYYRVAGDQNHNDVAASLLTTVSIAKVNAELTAPTAAENLAYTGEAQALLATAGEAKGGQLMYAVNGSEYAAEQPAATDAGTYTVAYKLVGDQNHYDVEGAAFEVSIAKVDAQLTAPVAATELVYTGQALELVAAGETEDGTILYAVNDGEFAAELPTAVNAGSYTVAYKLVGDNNHNDLEAVTMDVISIAKAEVTLIAPVANNLVYTGEAQVLITAGQTADGTIEYAIGDGEFSAELPQATNVGTYVVSYRVVGDQNHNDLAAATLEVTIANARATVTVVPQAVTDLAYTGEPLPLITAGAAEGGEMQYALGEGEYSTDLPSAINAGTYTVYYRVVGDESHAGVDARTIEVTIAKVDAQFITAPQAVMDLVENGEEHELITAGISEDGEVEYSLDGVNFSAELPVAIEAGEYIVYYYVVADSNHNDTEIAEINVTIAPAGPHTAIENINAQVSVKKIIRDNQVLIIREGRIYSTTGVLVE